jgi:hypothetical protein
MPFLAPALPYIATGVSALAGGLNNRKQKTTSSTSPTFSPEFQRLLGDLMGKVTERMGDPAKGVEPLRLGLMEGVNRRYSTLPQRVTTSLSKRGFANSGQLGSALKGVEMARMGEQGDIATKMAELTLGREDSGYDIAMRMLGLGRGSESESTSPGNVAGGAVSGGAETLTTLMMLDKLLKGGGSSTGVVNTYPGMPGA